MEESTSSALLTERSSPYRYDAFISYSSTADYAHARKVETFLESFHKAQAPHGIRIRPLQICRDGSDFRLPVRRIDQAPVDSDPIWQIIQSQLSEARYLLVLCSPGAVASPWVSREISWMLEHRRAESILLAVTAANDPINQPEENFPTNVREARVDKARIWYDLRGFYDSNRPNIRNYEDELVRLAADLLDWDTSKHGPLLAVWERDKRRRRKRQILTWTAAAIILSTITAIAIWRNSVARYESQRAESRRLAASATSLLEKDPRESLRLAVQANEVSQTDEAESALRTILLNPAREVLGGHTEGLRSASFSPDGRLILTASSDNTARVWDLGIGKSVLVLQHQRRVNSATFSPDGQFILTAGDDSTARIWEVSTGKPITELRAGFWITYAKYSP